MEQDRSSTGIRGLDEVLGGGLPSNRMYLIQGDPGTGKTTLALQFLLAGIKKGETALFITLSETASELRAVAAGHGWDLDGLGIFEVQAGEEHLKPERDYTAFHPSEVELSETVHLLLNEIERIKPRRVVIDSLSEMRLLARDPLRYRRQMLALKQVLVKRDATILLLDDPADKVGEHQFQTLAHGVILLERRVPEYGRERRRLNVHKLRGISYDGGYHDFRIRTGGIELYPSPVPNPQPTRFVPQAISSGVSELDDLLSGGPERGTSLLITGAAGTGKSTLAIQYAVSAAQRGEKAAAFIFDERLNTLAARTKGVGLPLSDMIDERRLNVQQVDPAAWTPGQFVQTVREAVENGARIVIIDSLNGYINAMPGEHFLLIQMHELLTYLASEGVLTIMVVAQQGLVMANESPVDMSYLADTVLLTRYFEHAGRVRKAISVVKKRSGRHEDTIRELKIDSKGIRVGQPLAEFSGVLTGIPQYTGTKSPLIREGEGNAG